MGGGDSPAQRFITIQLLHRLSLAVAVCAGATFQASAQPGNRLGANADQVSEINGRNVLSIPLGLFVRQSGATT